MKMRYMPQGPDKDVITETVPTDQTRVLVVEDGYGRRTPYYPGLAWNDLACFSPSRFNPCECLTPEEKHKKIRKISSAKNILRDISLQYETLFRDSAFGYQPLRPESQAFFHSNMLYLIAATDGNEDNIGHSQLVARYTLQLAKALGMEEKSFLVDIERGAMLHDIGKIGIPESILRKPGALNTKEREIVKEHPLLGYEMIEEFLFLRRAARVVLFHHESYDGRGYPYGLLGDEIPLEARIFSLADTLDAITSDRPYRKGQSFQEAFDEIEKGRGTQFDPSIVDAFFSVSAEKWKKIKQETEESLRLITVH